jgi:hypothetical protein
MDTVDEEFFDAIIIMGALFYRPCLYQTAFFLNSHNFSLENYYGSLPEL